MECFVIYPVINKEKTIQHIEAFDKTALKPTPPVSEDSAGTIKEG